MTYPDLPNFPAAPEVVKLELTPRQVDALRCAMAFAGYRYFEGWRDGTTLVNEICELLDRALVGK